MTRSHKESIVIFKEQGPVGAVDWWCSVFGLDDVVLLFFLLFGLYQRHFKSLSARKMKWHGRASQFLVVLQLVVE